MVRQIFRNKVIGIAGPLPGQLTAENIKRWTTLRRGKFSPEFTSEVTHLLCTNEQFQKKTPIIRDALRRARTDKCFHLLHYDWFEFSAVEERKQPEKEYSMLNIIAAQRALQREKERIEKGKREGERAVDTNHFHTYRDEENFPYQIDITRDDETYGDPGQRYIMTLYESNAKPHLYWFVAKFLKKKGNSQPTFHRPSYHSQLLPIEMRNFTNFFRIKTGIEWGDRVLKEGTMGPAWFLYRPPKGGKPVGSGLSFPYDFCVEVNLEMRGLTGVDLDGGEKEDHLEGQVEDRFELDEEEVEEEKEGMKEMRIVEEDETQSTGI